MRQTEVIMEHRDHAVHYFGVVLLALILSACAVASTPTAANAPAPVTVSTSTVPAVPPTRELLPTPTFPEIRPSPTSPTTAPTLAPASPTVAPPSTATPRLVITPNPLAVGIRIDAARVVSQVVPLEGGTLRASAGDGTRFTLTIPNHALLQETTITLTPATLDKLPAGGGWSAALQLAPEGLILMQPVTLTLEIPNTVPAASVMGLSYYGAGADFHLYPLRANGTALTLPVMHFSGYGAGQGLAAAVGDHVPSTSEDRAEQGLEQLIKDSGAPAWVFDAATRDKANAIFQQWFEALQSEKSAARGDSAATARALASSRAWSGMLSLMMGAQGRDQWAGQMSQSNNDDVEMTIYNIKSEYTFCVRGGGFRSVLFMIQNWLELAQTIPPTRANELAPLLDLVEKCATLKLSFKSEVHGGAVGGTVVTQVSANVPLSLAPDLRSFTGEGPLTYRQFTIQPNPTNAKCSPWVFGHQDSTFRVPSLVLLPGMEIGGPPGDIGLFFDPGEPREIASAVCGGTTIPWSTSIWKEGFMGFHARERTLQGWHIIGFDVRNTDALKEYDWPAVSSNAGTVKETDSFLITHAPE